MHNPQKKTNKQCGSIKCKLVKRKTWNCMRIDAAWCYIEFSAFRKSRTGILIKEGGWTLTWCKSLLSPWDPSHHNHLSVELCFVYFRSAKVLRSSAFNFSLHPERQNKFTHQISVIVQWPSPNIVNRRALTQSQLFFAELYSSRMHARSRIQVLRENVYSL